MFAFFFFFFFYVFFSFSVFLFSLSFHFFNSQSTNPTRSFFRHDSRRICFNERGAATPWQTDTSKHVWRLSELVDTMQYVVRVEQRGTVCQSNSEPLLSTSATTRIFTVLLSGRFCLQNLLGSRRRRCSLSRAPVTRLKTKQLK